MLFVKDFNSPITSSMPLLTILETSLTLVLRVLDRSVKSNKDFCTIVRFLDCFWLRIDFSGTFKEIGGVERPFYRRESKGMN